MPRNVRNFWVNLEVDGRRTEIATGPRRRDGGFTLTVYQRDDGGIMRPLYVHGHAHDDGRLVLTVRGYSQGCAEIRLARDGAAGFDVATRR